MKNPKRRAGEADRVNEADRADKADEADGVGQTVGPTVRLHHVGRFIKHNGECAERANSGANLISLAHN